MTAKSRKHPLHKDMVDALDKGDGAAVRAVVEKGLPLDWRDDQGHGLLHHAAMWGDIDLATELLEKGADAGMRDDVSATPLDTARAFGHLALSLVFEAAAKNACAGFALPAGCRTLSDIRGQDVNYFVLAAREKAFAALAALATPADGFQAADLLQKLPGSPDTVLQLVCETGQLETVMRPQLWQANPDDLQKIWAEIPGDYKQALDLDRMISGMRQLKLQSREKPRLKGLDF